MRVENDTDEPHEMASQMTITDTQGNTFEPIQLDPAIACSATADRAAGRNSLYPPLDTPASDNTIRGGLVLFKVKTESLYNRPLVLHIESPSGGQGAEIDIDV